MISTKAMPLGATFVGLIFLYSGFKGTSVTGALRSLLSGQKPGTAQTAAITLEGSGSTGNTAATPTSDPAAGTLTAAQIKSLWTANGGDPSKATVANCIAQHESGGRTAVTSANPGPPPGTNVGVWQISTNGVGSGYTVAQLQDPNTNARLAIMGSRNGTDWGEWSTASMCGV